MKRFWIGAVLLVVLLAAGLGIWAGMDAIHRPIADTLEAAARVTAAGDTEAGSALARQAMERWQRYRNIIASAADHGPMDEIDGLFAQMDAYASAGQAADFAACCARLSQLVDAMQDAHSLTWWNLL